MESARQATPGDADRITELCVQAREELASERGAGVFLAHELRPLPRSAGPLGPQDEGDARRMWVGTYEDVVVGYVSADFLTGKYRTAADLGKSARGDRVKSYLNERGLRILKALDEVSARLGAKPAHVALAWLRAEGCAAVDAYALPGMRDTKNFFETFGFTARLLIVHRKLEE